MCQFIETMRWERGEVALLPFHLERVKRTLGVENSGDVIREIVCLCEQESYKTIEYTDCAKLRIVYDCKGILGYTLTDYKPRIVDSLTIIEAGDIDYPYKSVDRGKLNNLYDARISTTSDTLILRNGYLTDTTIANVALWDGRKWYTPKYPLLKGVKRSSLLEEGKIVERDIHISSLGEYSKIAVFNAMSLGMGQEMSIERLYNFR